MTVTIKLPDDAMGIKYVVQGEDGYMLDKFVTADMIVRAEQEENEGGKEHE